MKESEFLCCCCIWATDYDIILNFFVSYTNEISLKFVTYYLSTPKLFSNQLPTNGHIIEKFVIYNAQNQL